MPKLPKNDFAPRYEKANVRMFASVMMGPDPTPLIYFFIAIGIAIGLAAVGIAYGLWWLFHHVQWVS